MTKLSDNGVIAAEDLYYLLGGEEQIKVLDATFALPRAGVSPYDAFLGKHIDGAQFFDIDAVADREAPLPHTLPDAAFFAACVAAMGISNDDHVVIYDQSGSYMASSRAWWMFRVFGHENVYVLEGGLAAWTYGGYPVVSGPPSAPSPASFKASLRPDLVVTKTDLLDNIETGQLLVVDARPESRFCGASPEPWQGKRAGHIPRSLNLPFGDLIESSTRYLRDSAALESAFQQQGIGRDAKLAATCGSGVTACTIALALFKARGQDCAIYDGSWSEWGDESAGTPVEVSA